MGSYLGRLDGIEKRRDLFDPDQREPTLGRLDGIEKQRDLFDPDQREPTLGRLDGIEKRRDLFDLDRIEQMIVCYKQIREDSARQLQSEKRRFMFDFDRREETMFDFDRREETLGRLDGIEKRRDLFDLDRREQMIVCYKQIREDIARQLESEKRRFSARQLETEKRRFSARQLESEKRRFMFVFDRREETIARQLESERRRFMFDFDRREETIVCYKQIREDIARQLESERRRFIARQLESERRRFLFDFDIRKLTAILNADTTEEKMSVEKQKVFLCNRPSCHGTKLLNSSLRLAHLFVPCAGGTGQPEHQGHSEIYPSSLNVVSNCPSRGEYMQRSLAKCADVCGSYMQDGNCAYHCMRDYSKTKLVEFCAKPKPLFDYCPEYDPVDQTIQKDTATLCNSTFSQNYYNSSDIYFCDPNNCLQLHESSVRSSATTLTTLMSETTEMNGRDSQEWFLWLVVVLAALTLAAIIIGYILHVFVKRGFSSAHTPKMTEKRNQNGKQYVHREEIIVPDECDLQLINVAE